MKRICVACLLAAVLAGAHLRLSAAETTKFRYQASMYADDKGVGLHLPEGVACDSAGRVVIADTGNDRLLLFTYRDRAVGGGTVVKVPQVAAPARVQLNSKGEIYALDGKERRIVHLGAAGDFKEVVPYDGVPAPTTVVAKGFAIDSADTLYVLDVFSARVLVLTPQGKFERALPLPADIGFGSDIAVDFTGNVLLLDSINRRLFSAAKEAKSFTQLGGDLAQAIVTLPTALAASKGAIFVVEGSGSAIAGFGRDGSFLGRQLTMGWEEGMLNHPSQMCVNDKDDVFVADRDNSRVQVFRLTR